VTSLRRANGADAAAIAGVDVRAWHHAYSDFLDEQRLAERTIAAREARWRETLEGEEKETWVLEVAGRIVGYVSVREAEGEQGTGEIVAIYVDPPAQGAGVGTRLLVALRPQNIPRLDDIGVDVRVLLFACALVAATGLLVGLVPALAASRPALADDLRDGGGAAGTPRGRAQRAFVVAQVAVSVVLLPLTTSFLVLTGQRHGFFGNAFGYAIVAFIDATVIAWMLVANADGLNRAEAGRHNPPHGCKQACDHCRYPYGCTTEGCFLYCGNCCGGPF